MAGVALSCGVLVLSAQGELLLGHAAATPRWDIPKGRCEAGETEVQTAVRETAEETGLRFAPERLCDLGRFAYLRGKDLHLYAALLDRIDPAQCVCTTWFRDAQGRMRPEMDAFAWVGFGALAGRCGKTLGALLTQKIDLPALLEDLREVERRAGPVPWRWCAE